MRAVRHVILLVLLVAGVIAAQRTGRISQDSHPENSAPVSRNGHSSWGRPETLADHFARHGREVGASNPDDYVAKAAQLRQRALTGELPMKRSADGTLRVFDARTNAFAAYNANGTTKTFFRASDASYFQRQPGTLVNPSDLH